MDVYEVAKEYGIPVIADGGITTKNTLANTKGAVYLSLNTSYISGINLNVAYTRDEVFVIADKEALMFIIIECLYDYPQRPLYISL